MKQILPVLAILVSVPVAAEGFRTQHTYPAAYKDECGSCHHPFPAGMLNQSDWGRVMGSLDRHYGTDATIDDAATKAAITAWLNQHAGELRDADGDPPRFTITPWFKRHHKGVVREDLNRLGNGTPSFCNGCHQAAKQEARYSENNVSTAGSNRRNEDN